MYIKNPNPKSGHKGFRLMGPKSVSSKELDAINADFIAGNLPFDRARALVEDLRNKLDLEPTKSWLSENDAIAEEYCLREVALRANRAPKEAERRVRAAARSLGQLSLVTATAIEIKRKLSVFDSNKQRRLLMVINSLLRFKGRTVRIPLPREVQGEPEYLTAEEIKTVTAKMEPNGALCVWAAYATGARYGELFAFTPENLRSGGTHIWISSQRYADWRLGLTKNGKKGIAFVIPGYRKPLAAWCAVPVETKQAMRQRWEPAEEFIGLCKSELRRDLNFHHLRHSYARAMTWRGAKLEKLRNWMRDNMTTIERYYVSWVDSDADMEDNLKRFG